MILNKQSKQSSNSFSRRRHHLVFIHGSSMGFYLMIMIASYLLLHSGAAFASKTRHNKRVLGAKKGGREVDLLMVGNSYTQANNLEGMVKALLEEGLGVLDSNNDDRIYTDHFTRGAATWHDYVTSPGKELEQKIARGAASGIGSNHNNWTFVILQEQSQTPAFFDTDFSYLYTDSLEAVRILYDKISNVGAETVLLLTWGRLHGDSNNPGIYPNYTTMQNLLTEGYLNYRDVINHETTTSSSQDFRRRPLVKVAPAGLAFQLIYDRLAQNGTTDPTKPGTMFSSLYSHDANHPSLLGTYLTALVIFSTLTGRDVRQLSWQPTLSQHFHEVLKDDATRDYLKSIAYETMQSFQSSNDQVQPQSAAGTTPPEVTLTNDEISNETNSRSASASFLLYYPLALFAFSVLIVLLYCVLLKRKQQQPKDENHVELEKLMRTNIIT